MPLSDKSADIPTSYRNLSDKGMLTGFRVISLCYPLKGVFCFCMLSKTIIIIIIIHFISRG